MFILYRNNAIYLLAQIFMLILFFLVQDKEKKGKRIINIRSVTSLKKILYIVQQIIVGIKEKKFLFIHKDENIIKSFVKVIIIFLVYTIRYEHWVNLVLLIFKVYIEYMSQIYMTRFCLLKSVVERRIEVKHDVKG